MEIVQDLATFCKEINKDNKLFTELEKYKLNKICKNTLMYLYYNKVPTHLKQTLEKNLYKNYYNNNNTFSSFLTNIYLAFSENNDILEGKEIFKKYLDEAVNSIYEKITSKYIEKEHIKIFILQLIKDKYKAFLVETYIKDLLNSNNIEVKNSNEELDTYYKIDLILENNIGLQIKADTFYSDNMTEYKREKQTKKQALAIDNNIVDVVYYIFYNIDTLEFRTDKEDITIYPYDDVISYKRLNKVVQPDKLLESIKKCLIITLKKNN